MMKLFDKNLRIYFLRLKPSFMPIHNKDLFLAGILSISVANPNPDPSDPYVFGLPKSGSGSISQRYGSGSLSPSRKSKKNLDSYCFVTSF